MTKIDFERIGNEFSQKGFFSEYLPATYNLECSHDIFDIALSQKPDLVEPLSFTMSRFSGDDKRRAIYIPELASYVAIVKYMKDKSLIKDIITISKDKHSFSPILQKTGEITRHEELYNASVSISISSEQADQEANRSTYIPNVIEKIRRSKGACGVLNLDISNFYISIYTHLLPSIKLGYENAEKQYKAIRADNTDPVISNDYRIYSELDRLMRNMNGGRTNGLLPGVLVSQFLAEALLAQVDHELESLGLQFVRYVDDYEIFIYDKKDIVKHQNLVASTLKKYFLTLNNEKTKYTEFPYYIVENLDKIYMSYSGKRLDAPETMKLFNVFLGMEASGTKGAIRFLIKSINKKFNCSDQNLYSTYLLNVLVNDSRSLVKVCQLMIEQKSKLRFSEDDIKIIDNLLVQHLDNANHLETIWLLYLRKHIKKGRLAASLIHKIIHSGNDLAIVMLLEEYTSSITHKMQEECKSMATSWLLCYQMYLHNFITKDEFSEKSKIKNNLAYYAALKRKNFSFYKV